MLMGHVLTSWEIKHYAQMFDLPESRFELIPWPLRNNGAVLQDLTASSSAMVMSSGRVARDWETLFRAAEGRQWSLTIVCSKKDLPRIQRLNRNGRANVYCEIEWAQHEALLKTASVYVLSVKETEGSCGQVALACSVELGIPVICPPIKGLEGYILEDETALLYTPGDWLGLRAAIESLLSDEPKRKRLSLKAFERAAAWTNEQYENSLRKFITGLCS